MIKKPKAIIFDMNGVITDDESIHEEAFRRVLSDFNFVLTHLDYADNFAGRSDQAGSIRFIEKHPLPISSDELVKRKMDAYWRLAKKGIPQVPGVVDAIEKLAKKYILGLATGSSKKEMDTVIQQCHLAHFFTAAISVEDYAESKPSPVPYLMIAKKMNVPSKECMVIEDAPTGIESAKGAGMLCVAITTTHKRSELQAADEVISSFDELFDLLN